MAAAKGPHSPLQTVRVQQSEWLKLDILLVENESDITLSD